MVINVRCWSLGVCFLIALNYTFELLQLLWATIINIQTANFTPLAGARYQEKEPSRPEMPCYPNPN